MASKVPTQETPLLHPVRRPFGQLHLYPAHLRWEFTRRHPYYQLLWNEVQNYHRNLPEDDEERRNFGFAAKCFLGAIGVSGDPIDPAVDRVNFLKDCPPGLLDGPFRPITILEILKMLVNCLEPGTLWHLGAKFVKLTDARCFENECPEEYSGKVSNLLDELSRSMIPEFSTYPLAPLFYLHLDASQSTIVKDAKFQIQRWKKLRNKDEKPPKIDLPKIEKYLEVWDRREGWTGKDYDLGKAMVFSTISSKLRTGLSTVHSRYTAAFELVTGIEYTFERRMSLLGPLVAAGTSPETAQMYMKRFLRQFTMKSRRDLPETLIDAGERRSRSGGIIENESAVGQFSDESHDFEKIKLLIDRHMTDEEIRREMDFEGFEVITAIRKMIADGKDFPS